MFKCECGSTEIVESMTYIARNSDVISISVDEKLIRNNPVFDYENAELQGYFCKSCEKPITNKQGYRIKKPMQLIKFLRGGYNIAL